MEQPLQDVPYPGEQVQFQFLGSLVLQQEERLS